MVQVQLPFMILPLYAVLTRIDRSYEGVRMFGFRHGTAYAEQKEP